MATGLTSTSKGPVRPSSSPPEGLLDGIFARGAAASQTSGTALLQALLDVEAALARAWAKQGVIPAEAGELIARTCSAERFDLAALSAEAARHAQPVVGLVAALRDAVGPAAAEHVHHEASSQDTLDTALMLVARRAVTALLADLRAAAEACAGLAETHSSTPIIGRTLLQQGLPTTFGLKAAGWMIALDDAAAGLKRVETDVLAVQLGGPVGALAAPQVVEKMASELGLAAPLLPWHTDRRRPAELGSALAVVAGAAAKIARDVTLLAQNEVAEVREGGQGGGSSSMTHKRNPVAAISTLACAQRIPALVATLLSAMTQEHERAAGAWQAEWEPLLELLRLTGSTLAWTVQLLDGLQVDEQRMADNLAAAPVSEADRQGAQALVARALDSHRQRELS
jgi:3-carboxy-cis,cis-muconate cycloisomerase